MGGGSAGQTALEQYRQDVHSALLIGVDSDSPTTWINTDMQLYDDMWAARSAQGGNPYKNLDAYDPSDALAELDTKVGSFATLVEGIDLDTFWDSFVTAAKRKEGIALSCLDVSDLPVVPDPATLVLYYPTAPTIEDQEELRAGALEEISDASEITVEAIVIPTAIVVDSINNDEILIGSALTGYENRQRPGYLRSISKMKAEFGDADMTDSTNYMMALANREAAYERELSSANIDMTWKKAQLEFEADLQSAFKQFDAKVAADLKAQEIEYAERQQFRELQFKADADTAGRTVSIDKIRTDSSFALVLKEFDSSVENRRMINASRIQEAAWTFELDNTRARMDFDDSMSKRNLKMQEYTEKRRLFFELGRINAEMSNRYYLSAVELLTRMKAFELESYKELMEVFTKFTATVITAEHEEHDTNSQYDQKEALWDIELYQYAGNLLASVAGGVSQPGTGMSRGASAISGALSGASLGSLIGGSIAPATLTSAGGAGIGSAIGSVAGLLAAM